jgi:hypothetical protein
VCKCKPAVLGKRIKTMKYAKGGRKNPVHVDECIADFIELLNRYGIRTLGCCCGHNKNQAEVIISLDNIKMWNLGEEMRIAIKFNPRGDTDIE